jgi:hypothetical protein
MTFPNARCLTFALTLCLLLKGSPLRADDTSDPQTAIVPVLKVVPLERSSSGDAAELVSSVLPNVRFHSEARTNSLVLYGLPSELEQAVALLQHLDEAAVPPGDGVFEFELTLIELTLPADAPHGGLEVSPADLLAGEPAVGEIVSRQNWKLRLLEGQQGRMQNGAEQSVVSGMTFGPGGGRGGGGPGEMGRASYSREQFGSMLSATASMRDGGQVAVEFAFEQTRLDPGADDGELPSPPKTTLVTTSTVILAPGVPTLLGGTATQSGSGEGATASSTVLIGEITVLPRGE